MNTMDTYIDVLLTSLKKKEQSLEKLDRVVEKENDVLKRTDASIDELNDLQKSKNWKSVLKKSTKEPGRNFPENGRNTVLRLKRCSVISSPLRT